MIFHEELNKEMFSIDVTKYWLVKNDGKDDPMDLCLHGHAVVKIGERVLEDDCTVSFVVTNNHFTIYFYTSYSKSTFCWSITIYNL